MNVSKLADGKAQYSMLCRPDGGVLDDMLVYRLGPAEWMIVSAVLQSSRSSSLRPSPSVLTSPATVVMRRAVFGH